MNDTWKDALEHDLPEEVIRQIRQEGQGLLPERIPHGTRLDLKAALVDDGVIFEDHNGDTLSDMLSLEPGEAEKKAKENETYAERIKRERKELAQASEQEHFLAS